MFVFTPLFQDGFGKSDQTGAPEALFAAVIAESLPFLVKLGFT